jgi:MFS transporter, FHS family, L-fucose permease
MTQTQRFTGPFLAVTSLFLMWGFITVIVDAFVPRLKDVFELELWQAGMVQFAWFAAYGLVSIPGGLLIKRMGYKKGILLGLLISATGCLLFYPAAEYRVFELFLLALFVVAAGITLLQVAANPYVAVLGVPEKASARLTLAQAFNSLGATIAPILAAGFLLGDTILNAESQAALSEVGLEAYRAGEAAAVQGPFVWLALAFVGLAVLLGLTRLPVILQERTRDSAWFGYLEVLRNKRLALGALGIFVYVGTEVAIGSYLVSYGMSLDVATAIESSDSLSKLASLAQWVKGGTGDMDAKGVIGALLVLYWGGAMVGRFAGSALMQVIRPNVLLGIFAALGLTLVVVSAASSGVFALLVLLAVGLFNSIMFPTIFTLAIEDLGDLKPQGSGVLCTAIVGGAFLPPLFGFFADSIGFTAALMLCVLCYAYIGFYGLRVAARG